MDDPKTQALLKSAKTIAMRLVKVAAGKTPEQELKSDARSFRNTAGIVYSLGTEVERLSKEVEQLRARLRRIAHLEVRGAADAISGGDWKGIVDELQAVAQEALAPGSSISKPRRPRKVV